LEPGILLFMQYPCYNTGNTLLTEGGWFPFKIHNLVHLQDEEWYYILEDINGLRHFIPAEYYKLYGFKPRDEISCKVDKLNCTGRMILEPRHPVYNEGETYSFELVKYPTFNEPEILIVRDFLENIIKVPLCGNNKSFINGEKKVKCIVKSVKKGIPLLELSSE